MFLGLRFQYYVFYNRITFAIFKHTYHLLLCSDGIELGTGHNSTIKVDGQWYIVYHGRDNGDDLNSECRTARIARLNVDNGVLKVEKIPDDE